MLLYCGIVYYSAPHCIIPGCSSAGAGLLVWVTRPLSYGPGCRGPPAPPLPGFSAGGFGACSPSPVGRRGAGLVGWENRLLGLVVALERLKRRGHQGRGPGSAAASGLVASALTISPRFYFPSELGGPWLVAVPGDMAPLRSVPRYYIYNVDEENLASGSPVPSSTRPRSSAPGAPAPAEHRPTETSSPRTCCWTTTVRAGSLLSCLPARPPCPPCPSPPAPASPPLQPDRLSVGEGPA